MEYKAEWAQYLIFGMLVYVKQGEKEKNSQLEDKQETSQLERKER